MAVRVPETDVFVKVSEPIAVPNDKPLNGAREILQSLGL